MPDYNLFNSTLDVDNPQGYVTNISRLMSSDMSHSKHWQGGDWMGTLTIDLATVGEMQQLYNEALGWHFEETTDGLPSFTGLVYEMDFVHGGLRRRRTLDNLFNSVKVRYTDEAGVSTETAATTQAESIAEYGQREEVLTSRLASSTIATDMRDVFFKDFNWPYSKHVARGNSESFLELTICGYAFTANWRYVTQADGTTGNLSAYVQDIIDNDMEYLTSGVIDTNTVQVYRYLDAPMRAWDLVQDLVEVGDGSQGATRAWVDRFQRMHYQTVDYTDIKYYWDLGGLKETIGSPDILNPRLVGAGIVRDLTDIIGIEGRGDSDFQRSNDFLMTGVSVNEAGDLAFTIGEGTESEIHNEYIAFVDKRERQIERMKSNGGRVSAALPRHKTRPANVQGRINRRRKTRKGLW